MIPVFSRIFLMIVLTFCTGDIAVAEEVGRLTPMDERQAAKIYYQVAKGYTIVDQPKRTFFIDYEGGVLYNLSKETDVCKRFSLSRSGQEDDFATAQLEVFTELTFQKEVQREGEKGDDYSTYTLVNAPQAMLHRGVVSRVFKKFGVSFTPGVTDYRIDLKHGNFQQLLELAQYNGTATSRLNPLVYQLDVTHLLCRFGGVPLSRIKRGEVTAYSFTVSTKKILAGLLPPGCAAL